MSLINRFLACFGRGRHEEPQTRMEHRSDSDSSLEIKKWEAADHQSAYNQEYPQELLKLTDLKKV